MLWEEGDSNRRHRKYKLGYEASALRTELRRQSWINAVKLQKLQIVMQWHTGINQCTSPSLASCGAAYGAPNWGTTWLHMVLLLQALYFCNAACGGPTSNTTCKALVKKSLERERDVWRKGYFRKSCLMWIFLMNVHHILCKYIITSNAKC